jgi:hypothetical protein
VGIWYCTREDFKSALDSKLTARDDRQADRAIDAGARSLEGLLRRRFYPLTETRTFDWPNDQHARPWRLWLDDNELVSVSALSSGGTSIASSDYFLRPDTGPPFNRIEIDLDSSAAFGGGNTHQRDISVTGVWGYDAETDPAGALENAIADTTGTSVDVTDGSLVGVGSILVCESERMVVTGRQALDTAVDTGTSLTASAADDVLDADVGAVGEVLVVGSERMLVVDDLGTTRAVKRAWDGTTLAAHSSGADVLALRTLTVERGALGSTAATHADATALTTVAFPGLVRTLNIAEAINIYEQERAGWARTAGNAEAEREAVGRALRDLRDRATFEFGRKARARAV